MSAADRTYLFENVKRELLEKHRKWQLVSNGNDEKRASGEKEFDRSAHADACLERKLKPCLKKYTNGSSGGSNNLTSPEESTSGTTILMDAEGHCQERSSDRSRKKVKRRVRVHRHDSIITSDAGQSISKNLLQENRDERHPTSEQSTERNSGSYPKTSSLAVKKLDAAVHRASVISPVSVGRQTSVTKMANNVRCVFPRVPDQVMSGTSRLNHEIYQSYVAGILHSSKKSEKFLKLQKLYATLERISQLESLDIDRKDGYFERGKTRCRSQSLSNLTLTSDTINSGGKLDHLCELRRIYQELEMVLEDRELSYFLKKDLSKFKWKEERDSGLYNRCHSIQDLIVAYQRKIFHEAFLHIHRQQGDTEFDRAFCFDRLRQKYQQLDKRAAVEKTIDRFWRSQSHRRSVNSQNASKLSGTYIRHMESAGKKSKERAVHGYFMNESRNGYEIYVNSRKRKTKSNPSHAESFPLQEKLVVGADVRVRSREQNSSDFASGKRFYAVPHQSDKEFENSVDDISWRQNAMEEKEKLPERRNRKEETEHRQVENACFNGRERISVKVPKDNISQKLNDSGVQKNCRLVSYKEKAGKTNWASQLDIQSSVTSALINTGGKYIQRNLIDEPSTVQSPGSSQVDLMFKKSDCRDFSSTSSGTKTNSEGQLTKTHEGRQKRYRVLKKEVHKCPEKYLFSVEDGTNLSYSCESVGADDVSSATPQCRLKETEEDSHDITEPIPLSTDFRGSYVAGYDNSRKNMLERNGRFLYSDPCLASDHHISADRMCPAFASDEGQNSYQNQEDARQSCRDSEDSLLFYPNCGGFFVSARCSPTAFVSSEPVSLKPKFITGSHADGRKINGVPETNSCVFWQTSMNDQDEFHKSQMEFLRPNCLNSEQSHHGISMTVTSNGTIGEFEPSNLPSYSELVRATSRNELDQNGSLNSGQSCWSSNDVLSSKAEPNTARNETFFEWKNCDSEPSVPSQMRDVSSGSYYNTRARPGEAVVSEIDRFNVETERKHGIKVADSSCNSLTCEDVKIHSKDAILNRSNGSARLEYDTNGDDEVAAFDYDVLQDLSRGMSFRSIVHCHRMEVKPQDLMRNLEMIGSEWQSERPQNCISGSGLQLTARNGYIIGNRSTMVLSCRKYNIASVQTK